MSIFAVGDKALLVKKWGDEPKEVAVVKVTKTEQVTVDGYNRRFKVFGSSARELGGTCRYRHENAMLYPMSAKEQVEANRQERIRADEEAAKKQEAANRERESCYARELEQTRQAMSRPEFASTAIALPAGTQFSLYVVNMPVKQEYIERKGIVEVVVVKVWKETNKWSLTKETEIRSCYTYTNTRSGSFPSCSDHKVASEEEAILEACNDVYHKCY